jgi:hypothetical protein
LFVDREKFPFTSEIVPVTAPFTPILTPIKGSLVSASVTLPPILVCAKAEALKNRIRAR